MSVTKSAGGAAPLVALAEVRAAAQTGEARRIRVRLRLTQSEVAAACGVTPSAISRWEAGDRMPRGSAAQRYAGVLQALGQVSEG